MKPTDIIASLFNGKGMTLSTKHQGVVSRVQKAQNMAQRQKIHWADVLAAMTEEQRKQVQHAGIDQ